MRSWLKNKNLKREKKKHVVGGLEGEIVAGGRKKKREGKGKQSTGGKKSGKGKASNINP